MAIILKSGEVFTDDFGNTTDKYYGCINQCNGNKKDKEVMFVLEIYTDLTSKEASNKPVAQFNYTVDKDSYIQWFGTPILDGDTNPYKQAYLYLLQLRDASNNLVWNKWRSDEKT